MSRFTDKFNEIAGAPPPRRKDEPPPVQASPEPVKPPEPSKSAAPIPPLRRGTAFTIDESKLRQQLTSARSAAYKAGRYFSHVLRNWVWYGLGALLILVWVNDKPTSPPPRPKAPAPAVVPTPDIIGYLPTRAPSPVPASPPVAAPVRPVEQPPIGTDQILTYSQIRWCVYEKVRIEAMQPLISNNAQVDLFNGYVNEYNSRCGNYRYRRGSLESIQRELETEKSRLHSEGVGRLARLN